MISRFRFGESSETWEKVMLCNFGGILCETARKTMRDVFGVHNSKHDACFALENFNYNDAWYELTGCNKFQRGGTSCTFLRDDALLLLHRFLAFNTSGKLRVVRSMVPNAIYCGLLSIMCRYVSRISFGLKLLTFRRGRQLILLSAILLLPCQSILKFPFLLR